MDDDILNETVSSEDLAKFEKIYHKELNSCSLKRETQFNYAWCLVRSAYPADIRKGIVLLQELFKTDDGKNGDNAKRDYLYYLAIGNARIKEYTTALRYTGAFLSVEPGNQQVANLENIIKNKLNIEGRKGMLYIAGASVAVGALFGLAMTLKKK